MTDNIQLLERRYGNARPGMQLLAVEDAAIPVTVVGTDVLAQERKPLPLIEEFVLRFVGSGVEKVSDVAALLGIDEDLVLGSAANQISESHIRRTSAPAGLALTPEGVEVMRDLASTQPVLKRLPVVFDRLIWRLVDYNRSSLLLRRDAVERGCHILPPLSHARISLDDVTAENFNAILHAREGYRRKIEILRIRKISPNTHRFLPAQFLVYSDQTGSELQLAVCIDGELQPEHTLGLETTRAAERLGFSVAKPEPRPLLAPELEKQRVPSEEVRATMSSAEPGLIVGEQRVTMPIPVRSVSVFEHTVMLADALERTTRRLLIIAPWVKSAVVTKEFMLQLERRIQAGVQVMIAHGIGRSDSGSDVDALDALTQLAKRSDGRFRLRRLKNSHAKILIFDDKWVTTSFNWLSFRGDPERTYRMEEGTLVQIPDEVDKAYSRYLQIIDEQQRL